MTMSRGAGARPLAGAHGLRIAYEEVCIKCASRASGTGLTSGWFTDLVFIIMIIWFTTRKEPNGWSSVSVVATHHDD
ncbi:hypothetical protein M752DRAFT_100168 [Aspergillus phoenicis ATCC 13157]|uniref:Uncharacterized protein n=1 Tax=Aspergillus phoenicis ATCC 13157 TaxID=1353007 RepID=A0A370PVR3_ASPPH|nr:hypothetical protein M752DRAFT_100168 [Aspergillus phoenicis ATCC 13157]